MNNLNMRRVLKQPALRMMNGGETQDMPNAAKAFIGPGIGGQQLAVDDITQSGPITLRNGGEIHADVGGMWDTLRSAFSTKAPRFSPTATLGIRGKVGGDLVTGHGGVVPGKGKGDKIPAKYEPGEFVVSNAMLDAQPELRGELRGLRKEVLAKQGMTPEEADAKALGKVPGQLRAFESFEGAGGKPYTFMDSSEARAALQEGQNKARFGPKPPAQTPLQTPAQMAGEAAKAEGLKKMPATSTVGRLAEKFVAPVLKAVDSPVGRAVGKLGGVGTQAMLYSGDAGAPTLDAERVAAMSRPYDPDWKPGTQGTNISDAILASEAGNRKSSQLRMAEAPAVAANSAVSNDDRKQSDAMLNSVMGRRGGTDLRNADINLNLLAGDQNTRDTANAAWAQRGAGIRVDAGPNGTPTFSNSTGVEKMRYTGVDGKPTNEYRNTQQYAEGMQERGKLLAAGAAADQRMQAKELAEADARERAAIPGVGMFGHNTARKAYENKMQLRQQAARDAATAEQGREQAAALREGHQKEYEGRMAPVRAAEAQRERMRKILEAASGKDGGKPIDPTALALQVGDKDLVKVFQDIKAGGLANTTSEQNLGDKRRDDLAKEFTVFTKNKNGENVADPRASAESLNMLRSIIPGLTSADAATREAAMPDARALHGIFANARNQDPVGWEAMKFWENKRPQLNDMPDAQGGSIEELSGLSGLLTTNASNGDTLLKQKDGRVLNLGVLDSRQRKLLDDAQQRGWGK